MPHGSHRRASKAVRFFRRKSASRRVNSSTARPFSKARMPCKSCLCASSGAMRWAVRERLDGEFFLKRKQCASRIAVRSKPCVSSSTRRQDGAQITRRKTLFGSGNTEQVVSPRVQCRALLRAQCGEWRHGSLSSRVSNSAFSQYERIGLRASSAARMDGSTQAGCGGGICVSASCF